MTTFNVNFCKQNTVLIGLFLAVSLRCLPSYADQQDTFNVVAKSSYTHDSNLFKLPSGLQPPGAGSERSDNIFVNSLGFTVNKQYSLQAFRINFDHVVTKYDNAKFLDFSANNYKAAWLWAITPDLTGILSTERRVSLVPFRDARSGLLGSNSIARQNIRTIDMQNFSVDYSPHDKWHLIGGFSKLDVTNSQTFLPETSFKQDSIEGGVKYEFRSKSYISLISRKSDGQNQDVNTTTLNPNAIGSGFEERQQELSGLWVLTGKSRLLANVGHIRREDNTFGIRDFSGNFGGLNYVWDITGKTNLSIGLSRRLSSFQTANDSYGVIDTLDIRPTWHPTSKISVNLNAQLSQRVYKGDGPIASNFQRQDDSYNYGIGMDWTPRSTIRLGVDLRRDERNSNVNNFDYSANIASINGQLNF